MPSKRLRQSKLDFNKSRKNKKSEDTPEMPTVRNLRSKQTKLSSHSSPAKPSVNGLFGKSQPKRRAVSDTENVESDEEPKNVKSSVIRRKSRIIVDEEDEDSDKSESEIGEPETSDDGGMNSTPLRKPKKKQVQESEESDEESDDSDVVVPSTRRGRLKRTITINSQSDESESEPSSLKRRKTNDEEIEAELQDLRESSPIHTPIKSEAAKRREALAKLQRRRQRRATGDTAISSDEEDEAEEPVLPLDEEDEYESDFLDDEDVENTPLGVPSSVEMPFAFTRLASASLEELFNNAVDWLIQNKINPGFDRDSEVYEVVWRRLNDELQGLAESKFKSSVWNRDFRVALEARPDIDIFEDRAINIMEDCQACNRSRHPATVRVVFKGQPYHPDSLEEVEQDVETYDHEFDHKGREVPPVRDWYLGKTCFENSHQAHTLAHWKHSLNDAVLQMLRDRGVLDPREIVERDSWSVTRKKNWTKNFVLELGEVGVVDFLWQIYQTFVDTARSSKKGNWK